MINALAIKQNRIVVLLQGKFAFRFTIRALQNQNNNLQQQNLNLQNNVPLNMADARCLPILKLIAPVLANIPPYTGQEPHFSDSPFKIQR